MKTRIYAAPAVKGLMEGRVGPTALGNYQHQTGIVSRSSAPSKESMVKLLFPRHSLAEVGYC